MSGFWKVTRRSSRSIVVELLIGLCALSFLALASLAAGGSISVAEKRNVCRPARGLEPASLSPPNL